MAAHDADAILRHLTVMVVVIAVTFLAYKGKIDPATTGAVFGAALGYTGSGAQIRRRMSDYGERGGD